MKSEARSLLKKSDRDKELKWIINACIHRDAAASLIRTIRRLCKKAIDRNDKKILAYLRSELFALQIVFGRKTMMAKYPGWMEGRDEKA
jgi:hypothetical protein